MQVDVRLWSSLILCVRVDMLQAAKVVDTGGELRTGSNVMLPSTRRPGSTAPEWLEVCLQVFCQPLMPPICDTVPEPQPFHAYLTKLAKPCVCCLFVSFALL